MEYERDQDKDVIAIKKSNIIKTYNKYREIAKDPFSSEQDKIKAISELKILDDLFGDLIGEEEFKVKTWDDLVLRDQNVNYLLENVPGFEKDRKRLLASIQITQILKHPNSFYGKFQSDKDRKFNIVYGIIRRKEDNTLYVSDKIGDIVSRINLLVFSSRDHATNFLNNNYQLCEDYLLPYAQK